MTRYTIRLEDAQTTLNAPDLETAIAAGKAWVRDGDWSSASGAEFVTIPFSVWDEQDGLSYYCECRVAVSHA
jgi:hypothetical protein